MFEADAGLVFLADGLTNGALAEATAAQLGFAYEADPPFAGRKGRTRLAVVDGVVNEAVVRLLVSALPERERVVVCGTGIDTDARPVLRELRPGSTLRKIPAALLDEYRSTRQLRLALGTAEAQAGVAGPSAAVEASAARWVSSSSSRTPWRRSPPVSTCATRTARRSRRSPRRCRSTTTSTDEQPPFEAVIDSATGVGKTYILAGAMELFAIADGVRDFVIVTPGRTILEKTRDNFTPGHPKSLLGPMSFAPVVDHAENFNTPAMRAAMDDDDAGQGLPLHGPVAHRARVEGRAEDAQVPGGPGDGVLRPPAGRRASRRLRRRAPLLLRARLLAGRARPRPLGPRRADGDTGQADARRSRSSSATRSRRRSRTGSSRPPSSWGAGTTARTRSPS